jgi:hypothetical protein
MLTTNIFFLFWPCCEIKENRNRFIVRPRRGGARGMGDVAHKFGILFLRMFFRLRRDRNGSSEATETAAANPPPPSHGGGSRRRCRGA